MTESKVSLLHILILYVGNVFATTYWYGYSWGTISQTCLFYRDGIVDLKTGQKEVSSALEILGAKAPGYIEQVIDAMSYPQFEGCLDLVE